MAEGLFNQYREKLKKAIGTARFYGLPDRPLEKVFVELTVIEDFEIPRDAEYKALMDKELRRRRTLFPKDETEEDDSTETDEEGRKRPRKVRRTVKPEELLEAGKRSQVVGAPGCGKTTLLRWLAVRTTKTTDRLPVFIELKRLQNDQFNTLNKGFSKFLFENGVSFRFDPAETPSKELELLEGKFNTLFASGSLVVLLDGLDEIAETERHRLQTAVENYSNHHEGGLTLIVSTRPYGYLRNFADLKAMEIEPLSDIQIDQFLNHWCEKWVADNVKASLRKNPNLRGLARFPFLLAFIAHLKSGGDIPRTELYQQIVSELVTKLDKDKGVERFKINDPSGTLKRGFLRQLSFERLFESRTTDLPQRLVFSFEELVEQAEIFLRKKSRNFPPEDLAFDVCATPLLREVENERYTFAHLTIQEFLAAEELSKREDRHQLFTQAFFNRQLAEMEVLPMTIGQMENPNEFYDLLVELPESIDFIGLRLQARAFGYFQTKLSGTNYKRLQRRLMDFAMEEIQSEAVFSSTLLNSFRNINSTHFLELADTLLSTIREGDWYRRQLAALVLGKLDSTSNKVIKRLLEALEDESDIVRQNAATALGKLGLATSVVISQLTNSLNDHESYVRRCAIKALSQLGFASKESINTLALALRNSDEYVRQLAVEGLSQIGMENPFATTFLCFALKDQSTFVRQFAAKGLGETGNTSPVVIYKLFSSLCDSDPEVRETASDALAKLSKSAPDIVDKLINELQSEDWGFRLSITFTLGKLRNLPKTSQIKLLNFLKSSNPEIRQLTALALGSTGSNIPEVCSALLLTLKDENKAVRLQAAYALSNIRYDSPEVQTELFSVLRRQEESSQHLYAAEALCFIGNKSPEVRVALINGLSSQVWKEWLRAVNALVFIGKDSPEIQKDLVLKLQNSQKETQKLAALVLIQIGNTSSRVISLLVSSMCDQGSFLGHLATNELVRIGFCSQEVHSTLIETLQSQNLECRKKAAETLGKIGHSSPNIISALIEAVNDNNQELRRLGVVALGQIGFNSPSIIDALISKLQDKNEFVRRRSVEALGKIGAVCNKTVTSLIMSLNDEAWGVRLSAVEALERIGFDSPQFLAGLKLSRQQ